MLTIWGRKNSSNVMPVMWTVGELGLEHVRHNVGGSFGGLDTEAYGAMNPNRKVPTLDDGGFVMWESNAIVRYLCRQYGLGSLWPDAPQQLALADQWMEWLKTTVMADLFPLFWGLVRTPPDKRDDDALAQRAQALGRALLILEHHLGGQPYVAGESLTMGDIPLGTGLYRYFNLDTDRPSLPNVEQWYARLCERPAFQRHVMIPFGSSPEEWLELERSGAAD